MQCEQLPGPLGEELICATPYPIGFPQAAKNDARRTQMTNCAIAMTWAF